MRRRARSRCSVEIVSEWTVRPAGRPDRELSPAGADLEQPGAGAHADLVEQRVHLAPLGVGQRGLGGDRPAGAVGVEQCRRVRHRLVQEQREQVVGQVVVAVDVAPGTLHSVAFGPRWPDQHQPPQPLQPGRHERVELAGERGQQTGQLGLVPLAGVPVAGLVGLAEPDQPAAAQAAVERPGVVQPHHGAGRGAGVVGVS
jgi:hypothetical protein